MPLPEIIAHNQEALDHLTRALTLGSGQFSLILARANYRRLCQILLETLATRHPFQRVHLPNRISSLREALQAALQASQPEPLEASSTNGTPEQETANLSSVCPSALMVTGLDHLTDPEAVFRAANLGRDAFIKTFNCPVVLWVSDRVLQSLNQYAPDFKSFAAAPIRFDYPLDELVASLHRAADNLFHHILDASQDHRLGNTTLHLPTLGPELKALIDYELPFALADLKRQNASLDADLQASLQFLQGRDAHNTQQMETARTCYEQSLQHWQQLDTAEALDKRAVLLFHLGLWWRSHAVLQRATYRASCEQARRYFTDCLAIFQQQQRPDRLGRFLHALAEVLQKLEHWNDLATLAQGGLTLHQGDLIRLARDYGYLAEVALASQDWPLAQVYAEQSLEQSQKAVQHITQQPPEETLPEETLKISPDVIVMALRYHQGWYHFLLGQAQLHQGNVEAALQELENARQQTGPKYDLPLYRKILGTLRDLYYLRKEYRRAFYLKLEQRQVENLFGLRAFIGASPIQPYHETPYLGLAESTTLATEIRASGRQHDVEQLVERLVQPRYPLVVIHGPSGVGKSSILRAGLVPALQQTTPEGRITIPVLIHNYRNWPVDIEQALQMALSLAWGSRRQSASSEFNELGTAIPLDMALRGVSGSGSEVHQSLPNHPLNPGSLIARLRRQTVEQYQQVVLIFDQFEEFFFERPEEGQRLEFYGFLRDCLNLPYIKIVLSLREDYLHYLLEWDRFANLDIINNDILSREVRYYLGNFQPEDAEAVIRQLTENAQFYLEDELITALVAELANPRGEIRPIELQVVGAELQRENITTLQQYQQLGEDPKEALVHNFLHQVIQDCGPGNGDLAQAVLYLLSDDSGPRPLKTQLELEESLELAGILASSDQLDLVLEILTGSGIVFEMPEVGGVRYQLVHDYLVDLIQQQDMPGLIEALQQERRRRKLTEDQLRDALREQAIALEQAQRERLRAEQAEIRALVSVSQARLLSHDALGALIAALKGARRLVTTQMREDLRIQTIFGLWQAIHSIREKNRLVGHRDWVLKACFSPDGQHIASASDDNTVILWSLAGEPLQTLTGHQGSVLDVTFSPDGQRIASASDDRTIKLWTLDGTLVRTLEGHRGAVNSVAFSPTEAMLASASNDQTLRIWTLDGVLVRSLDDHSDWVRSVSFSPEGQRLVSTAEDATIKIWRLTGELLQTCVGHAGWVLQAVFSPDGNFIASGGDDNTVRLWSLTGQLLQTFEGHQDWVRSVGFTADGQRLVSASDDRTIKLWNLDGNVLQTLRGHRSSVLSVDIHPDQDLLVTASDDDTIRLWQVTGYPPTRCEGHRGIVWDVCWQPQGTQLISAGADDTLKRWDATGQLLKTLGGHRRSVYGVAWSPDGQVLASASADQTVRLWTPDGQGLHTLTAHQDAVWGVDFSPDGQLIASAGADGTVRLWRRDGAMVKVFPAHTGAVWSVAFSPDGQHLVSAGEEGVIRLWHLNEGLLRVFSGHGGGVWDAGFSPDGRWICSGGGDSTLRLWDLNGREKLTLRGHRDWVRSLSFSPDGRLIASASDDTTVKLWSCSGDLLQTLKGHTGIVWRVDFDSTGNRLASASADGTIRIWDLRLDQLIQQGCEWLQDYLRHNRSLSAEDREICQDI
jgi:WD40 repeat protein